MGRIGRRARVGDTIEVEGRRMRVVALDGLRVARVWISTPASTLESDPGPDVQSETLRRGLTPGSDPIYQQYL